MTNSFENALTNYFGHENLKKIQSVKIGIAGLGGLGSNCAMNLVRCGFKNFILCDFDKIEPSNLNRQFYFADQLGKYKADALSENLKKINPSLEILSQILILTKANMPEIFTSCDVVVEAFDKAEMKTQFANAFINANKFCVSASGLAGWGNSDKIVTKKIRENYYLIGDLVAEAGPGRPPCSPRVNIAAAKEADVILAWVLGAL
ncbi:MAG: sulfur carrier protein ThiS adenylyltransferase ThiF [Endomicrobiales bacterium]|nr:sulfur carrier protein ThiS adenylyltransferase ThiF [Endomicrobiales bacterium]